MDTPCARHTSPGLGLSRGRENSYIFTRNPLRSPASFKPCNLGKGHLSGAAARRAPPCASAPKTSEEGRNDQMKSAERASNMRGTGGIGRLHNTQDKGRQFSGSQEANAQQARSLSCRSVSLPDGRHGFTFLPHATAFASDALRPHGRQQQVPQPLLLGSGTQRRGARPHIPGARAAPAEPAARADWPSPEGAGAPPRARGPRLAQAASGNCKPPARLVPARGLAGWLAGPVAILSPGNRVPPHTLLAYGARGWVPASKMAAPKGNRLISHMALSTSASPGRLNRTWDRDGVRAVFGDGV